MGAWGAGLYSDDTTCDVREDYVNNLKHGNSDQESYVQIITRYGSLLENKEIACLVYFALADTAWRYGRLDDHIKSIALSLMDSGADLSAWAADSPKDVPARRRMLEKLKQRLLSPQPQRKPVKITAPKAKKIRTSEPIGTVFSINLPGGKIALLILVAMHELKNGIDPVFSVVQWTGTIKDKLPEITSESATLVFNISGKKYNHVAIFPGDERKKLLGSLNKLDVKLVPSMPYNKQTVWMTVDRIALEVNKVIENLEL